MNTKEEYRKHVSDQTYHALESAGDLCRLQCQEDPDLLDFIADGIWRFLSDGDVFDQVMITFFQKNPEYVGHCLANLDPDLARKIVGEILD